MTELLQNFLTATGITLPVIFGVLLLIWIVKSFLIICDPNEIIIISGRKHRTEDGNLLGFKVLMHGRTISIPVIEQVARMDRTLISVPIHIKGAYSEGGIPLTVPAIANVKLSSNPDIVVNAVERFLSKSREEIARVAQETLEGHLRGVLATMTPEEVNQDRLKFARQLQDEAESDLAKLGLQLDTFKIQHISDDRNYLENLGRKRISEIILEAEMAESDALRLAEEAEARARARGEVALIEADQEIKSKENELRHVVAECEATAKSVEERASQSAKAVRASEEKKLQALRIDLEALKAKCDITIPAEIEKTVLELQAKGDFLAIRENGKANTLALVAMQKAWKSCKGHALDIVVAQRIDKLFEQAALLVADLNVQNIEMADTSGGDTLPHLVKSYQTCVREVFSEICQTLGVQKTFSQGPTQSLSIPKSQPTAAA